MRASDLNATAATLVFFTLGLFGWGAQYILARGFYATRNTWIPAVVGTVLTFANLPVYWLLVRRAQHLGLAMASSIGITVYTVVIFVLLARRTHNREEGALVLFFVKICAASAVVGAVCYKLRQMLEPHLAWHTLSGDLPLLVAVTAVGNLLSGLLRHPPGIPHPHPTVAPPWVRPPRPPPPTP